MIKIKTKPRRLVWLAAPAAALAAVVSLAGPAQAQQAKPALNPASAPHATAKPSIIHSLAAYEKAVKSGNYIRTTRGLTYHSCVYHAPANAVVTSTKIIAPDGATQTITPCTHPTIAYPGGGATTLTAAQTPAKDTAAAAQASSSWFWAEVATRSSTWLEDYEEEYAVPANPAKDGSSLAYWGGLTNSPGNTLLQDVLTWNYNAWYVVPEYNWPSNNVVQGPYFQVSPGNTIINYLSGYDCNSAGYCTWDLAIEDANSGASTALTVGSGVGFSVIWGAVIEQEAGAGCVETPAGGHAVWRDIVAINKNGDNIISPSQVVTAWVVSYPSRQCSVELLDDSENNGFDALWSP